MSPSLWNSEAGNIPPELQRILDLLEEQAAKAPVLPNDYLLPKHNHSGPGPFWIVCPVCTRVIC